MRIALLIDGENVDAGSFPLIAGQCLALGSIHQAQVFADVSTGRQPRWLEVCHQFGLRPVLQLSGGKGKNSVDIAMTIAAMDVLHHGTVDAICLVATDSDYVPLAQRLREGGLLVYGFGRKTNRNALAQSCDRYFLLDAPEDATATPDTAEAPLKAPPLPDPPPVDPKPDPAPAAPAEHALADDERRFVLDLLDELCGPRNKTGIAPALVAAELHKRNPPPAEQLGGKFLKRLKQNGRVVEHGTGAAKTISPRRGG